jgi:hypothetical protein
MTHERIRTDQANAAKRILSILTDWMRHNPECSCTTKIGASGRFQVILTTPENTESFFGQSIQDAYAQAAQTIDFNGGTL